jgi:hypothetical protein
MRTVYKFEIQPEHTLRLPKGSGILSVGVQGDKMFLWALVDPRNEVVSEERRIEVYGTGHEIPNPGDLEFIGTLIMYGGFLVFHVFERVS